MSTSGLRRLASRFPVITCLIIAGMAIIFPDVLIFHGGFVAMKAAVIAFPDSPTVTVMDSAIDRFLSAWGLYTEIHLEGVSLVLGGLLLATWCHTVITEPTKLPASFVGMLIISAFTLTIIIPESGPFPADAVMFLMMIAALLLGLCLATGVFYGIASCFRQWGWAK